MAKFSKQLDWKLPAFEEFNPSELDWARMSAYIDGEGSILINPRRGRLKAGNFSTLAATFYLKITIASTDVRLHVWLKKTFGGTYKDANTPAYYPGKNVKVCWHWSAAANRAAWILHHCMPFFIIKAEQAEIGIKLQKTMRLFTRGRGKSLPIELVETRRDLKRQLLVMKARGRKLEPDQEQRIAEVS
jgi:hypothetical protein